MRWVERTVRTGPDGQYGYGSLTITLTPRSRTRVIENSGTIWTCSSSARNVSSSGVRLCCNGFGSAMVVEGRDLGIYRRDYMSMALDASRREMRSGIKLHNDETRRCALLSFTITCCSRVLSLWLRHLSPPTPIPVTAPLSTTWPTHL